MQVKPEFKDHPRYKRIGSMRLVTLEDYLQLAVLMWATHHNLVLPLDRSVWEPDLDIDLEEFKDWLFGDVDSLRVIEGGKIDEEEEGNDG